MCQGLDLSVVLPSLTNTVKKNGKIKSSYKREQIDLGCDITLGFAGPAIHGSALLTVRAVLTVRAGLLGSSP